MAWNEDRSNKRVKANDFSDYDITVKDLRRSMDFNNLGPKDVRRAEAVHLYVDVPGFHDAVESAGNDKQKQRKLVRSASVLRKIQRDLMDEDEVGDIQRQTVRLHSLVFKPYDSDKESNAAERAKNGVVHAITQNTYVLDIFDDVFETTFGSAAGLSGGTSYIANIGKSGDRELISLGSCANLAAKCLSGSDTISVTRDVYDDLPDSLKEHFKKSSIVSGTQIYQSSGLRWSNHPELAKDLGVKWDEKRWRKKTEEYRDGLSLDEIEISEARTLIDLESLTERNCKRTSAVTFYADLDGFTRYVREAEDDDSIISLIRQFHMIRAEFHAVVASDYEGLVIQHRGDCLLGILHMPCGDESDSKRCNKGVDIAIGLQSSMEHVLNKYLTDRKDIHVAIGIDVGKALVTRLGKKGRRISICFGPEVMNAEVLQQSTGARKIRVTRAIYDKLTDDDIRGEFKKDGTTYLATNLTFPKLDHIKEERAAQEDEIGSSASNGAVLVTTKASQSPNTWRNSSPWRSH